MDQPQNSHHVFVSHNGRDTALAEALVKRLRQLGLSRREFVKRSGISRQTLHNIEHKPGWKLNPLTLSVLDTNLRWKEGTALALMEGDTTLLEPLDEVSQAERVSALRWECVQRIQSLSLDELEALIYQWDTERE